MPTAKIKVKLNTTAIRRLDTEIENALQRTTEEVLRDVVQSQVIPFDKGTMQNDQTYYTSGDNKAQKVITTTAVQANRLYYNPQYNFQTRNNPNAKAGWFDDWIFGSKFKNVQSLFEKFMRYALK